MTAEKLAVLATIAMGVAAVLGYLHARNQAVAYSALQDQVSDNSRRIGYLERRR